MKLPHWLSFPFSKDLLFGWLLFSICVLNALHTLSVIEHPFIGQNAWRDAQTFGVARNFIEENVSIFQPSYDIRTSDDGRLPGEFPLQSYYCSLFMKMTSLHLICARLSNYVLGLMTALLLFFIGQKIGDKILGLIFAAMFLTNPLAGSQMVSVMPETMVNLLCVLAVFSYLYIEKQYIKWGVIILLTSVCTLVKPSGFVIISFLIAHDYLKTSFSWKSIIAYLLLIIVPLFCLHNWISYTLKFENSFFAYPITHHYVRTISDSIRDFGWEVFSSALEKTVRHSFNVAGMLGIILVFVLLAKRKLSNELRPWIMACSLWVLGGIAFLLYAGSVQTVQLYYASPLIIPSILICGHAFNFNALFRFLFFTILLLQSNIKLNTFNENYLESKKEWESFRMEKVTDRFSNRQDPFIVYPFPTPDFAMLGRLGRRGFNSESTQIFENKNHFYRYVCLTNASRKTDILPFIEDKRLAEYEGKEFYKLK